MCQVSLEPHLPARKTPLAYDDFESFIASIDGATLVVKCKTF